jgi:dihydrofolate synthase/folylpolyglutamate synthase
LLGKHQRLNAAVAASTVQALRPEIPVTEQQLRIGLETVVWAGRLQIIEKNGQTIVLDGAHNLAGVETLAHTLNTCFPSARKVFVLGMLQDKDWAAMGESLAPLANRIFVVPVQSDRTVAPLELAAICQKVSPQTTVTTCDSLSAALAAVANEPFAVIAGSLYLIGEAMELLHVSPMAPTGERGLNEWGATTSKGK